MDNKLEAIVNNEIEWRRHILQELKELKESHSNVQVSVSNLKVKVAFFGSVFGTIGSLIASFLKDKI